MTPEQQARVAIDALLTRAGWVVQDASAANIHAARGVALREFPLKPGHGFADYLLYVDGQAAGVIEAKKEGFALTGVETQADRYTKGLPEGLPRWHNPLPFAYQSTGAETRFTNGLDPAPRSRPVFAFHRAAQMAEWLGASPMPSAPSTAQGDGAAEPPHIAELRASYLTQPATFLARLQAMPPLKENGLWPAQVTAIRNLEQSLRENRPRALIQMATGSGKTFTAISFIYRLIKFAGARRVLFLVDRGNLADQTLKEFQQYASPYNNFKFTEEYIVRRLQGNTLDTTARVPERVNANFKAWLATQQHRRHPGESRGPEELKGFTPEQMKWLEMIRDHIAANLGIEPDDFEYAPFSQHGGLGKVHHLFGEALPEMLASLNDALAA